MTTIAVERVSKDGEVISGGRVFSMSGYMLSLTDEAIEEQKALMAAYDRAVGALLGPNDVQQEGTRTFKKKSAWRKLGRYFNISVEASLGDARVVEAPNGEWVAVARASAVAPWGQRWDDFGACGVDEEEGDRQISYADAIATAMTRAANRAVSNLIAMGEVSAEELGNKRAPVRERGPEPVCPKCGGKMWNNIGRKKSAKAPDYKCKDRTCDGALWPGQWPPKTPNGDASGAPEGKQRSDPTAGSADTATAAAPKEPLTAPNGAPEGEQGANPTISQPSSSEQSTSDSERSGATTATAPNYIVADENGVWRLPRGPWQGFSISDREVTDTHLADVYRWCEVPKRVEQYAGLAKAIEEELDRRLRLAEQAALDDDEPGV